MEVISIEESSPVAAVLVEECEAATSSRRVRLLGQEEKGHELVGTWRGRIVASRLEQ